ncbi:hypothetical protein [Clostridium sp. UBA7791]|uniref:hypothetical protein n=1 Tax=Clostridium sp. UBA7791 TaxID=1946379 RepID=UPI00321704D8
MEYIRIEYRDRVKEILEFISKEELGKWVVENFDNIKDLKPEDMARKIRINTSDGKEIVRKLYDEKASVLENIAMMVDDIKLEEERIGQITIIEPRVGVFK